MEVGSQRVTFNCLARFVVVYYAEISTRQPSSGHALLSGHSRAAPTGASFSKDLGLSASVENENMMHRLSWFLAFGMMAGCSQGPPPIDVPTWDPDGFADAILAKLDKGGDGSLDATELAGAPGLAFGAKYADTDKNKSLSREELVKRFEMYVERRLGLTSKQMQLLYKGRPVTGAKVKLVPDFFMAEVIAPATAETGPDGVFDPFTEGMELPGVRVGYYRVVVESSPRVKLPAKYASADTTTLGVEISPFSDDAETYGTIKLNITD